MRNKTVGLLGLLTFVLLCADPAFGQTQDVCDDFIMSPQPGSTVVLYPEEPLEIWAEFPWESYPALTAAQVWVWSPSGAVNYCDAAYYSYAVDPAYECLVAPWDAPSGWYTVHFQFSPSNICSFRFRVKRLVPEYPVDKF